jgi:hypothetical protein
MLIVPMLAGERMLGAVHLENHERDHAFGGPSSGCSRPLPGA